MNICWKSWSRLPRWSLSYGLLVFWWALASVFLETSWSLRQGNVLPEALRKPCLWRVCNNALKTAKTMVRVKRWITIEMSWPVNFCETLLQTPQNWWTMNNLHTLMSNHRQRYTVYCFTFINTVIYNRSYLWQPRRLKSEGCSEDATTSNPCELYFFFNFRNYRHVAQIVKMDNAWSCRLERTIATVSQDFYINWTIKIYLKHLILI